MKRGGRGEGCKEDDIEVPRGAFQALENLDEGRVRIDWWWV
jgi:hypothetical protein